MSKVARLGLSSWVSKTSSKLFFGVWFVVIASACVDRRGNVVLSSTIREHETTHVVENNLCRFPIEKRTLALQQAFIIRKSYNSQCQIPICTFDLINKKDALWTQRFSFRTKPSTSRPTTRSLRLTQHQHYHILVTKLYLHRYKHDISVKGLVFYLFHSLVSFWAFIFVTRTSKCALKIHIHVLAQLFIYNETRMYTITYFVNEMQLQSGYFVPQTSY